VSLHGLVRAKHLNGRDGIVISGFDRKTQERVAVRIVPLGDEKTKDARIKPENLSLHRACEVKITTNEGKGDKCPVCINEMDVEDWTGKVRSRMVCCGKSICSSCNGYRMDKDKEFQLKLSESVEETKRLIAEGKRDEIDVNALQQLIHGQEQFRHTTNRCCLCRAEAPKSVREAAKLVRQRAEGLGGAKKWAWAQYSLGNKYQNGAGVSKDDSLAFYWFIQAAMTQTDGQTPNMSQAIGACYMAGLGVEQSTSEALKWLKAAAEAGHAVAMHAVGQIYEKKGNSAKVIEWWKKGAEAGHAGAQSDLAFCYENSVHGAKLDLEKAKHWLKKAAEQGNAIAQYNLGGLLLRTEGQSAFAEAKRLCALSAASGYQDAQNMLMALNDSNNVKIV